MILEENTRVLSKKEMIEHFERVQNHLEEASEEVQKIYKFFKNSKENLGRVTEKIESLGRFLEASENKKRDNLIQYKDALDENVLYKVIQ